VQPDISSFAKIVAGGLPGAAVAGRKEIFDQLDFAATARSGREKIQHPGTFNANPVSAAAGTAALTVIAESDTTAQASRTAAALRSALNEVLEVERAPWAVYGSYSGFHTFLNPRGEKLRPTQFDPATLTLDAVKSQPKALANKLRVALLLHGVDVNGRIGGFLSATHTMQDVALTADAFRQSVRMLRQEGEVP
jgi:glutamate-1-semialdehyde 2,1-aminomutase